MPRERLPTRRQCETINLHYNGQRYHLTIGEYDDGRPGEVFLHGAKPGSLAAGIRRLGNGEPASIVGAIADVLAGKAAGPSSPGGEAP